MHDSRDTGPDAELFAGDGRLFKALARGSKIYGEYGCGQSTTWVLANTTAKILSVDSSEDWVNRVSAEAGSRAGRLDLRWVDIGRLENWGYPLGYEKRDRFRHYILSPWTRGESPDLVLIDGRFRVACFFAALLHGRPGTPVLFDDYFDRPFYALVEEFVPVSESCGRQACFEIPAQVDRDEAARMLDKFEYVMP